MHVFSEKVRKCIRALEAAETDTEKFATLFLVPKLVKGTECNKDARLSLMKGNLLKGIDKKTGRKKRGHRAY